MMVFVLDKHKKPLMPCTEKRARLLLRRGRAVVHRIAPFTIRLKDRVAEESALQPLRLKVKPGAKETGMAVLREETTGESEAVMLLELRHKPGIKQSLDSRRAMRRSRRNRKTRYRRPRFDNRNPAKCAACGRNARHGNRYCRPCERARNFVDNGYREKRLPASLEARANQIMNTVKRLTRLLPIASISYENAKFDTQLLQNPEIAGVEYQQGELFGYEVREYLLEKWGRQCAYCGKNGVPLEIEHIVPKSRDGTDRVSNLTLACKDCNQEKGTLTAEEFGHPEVQAEARRPMKEEAIVNATRWKLFNQLKNIGLPLECGTAALTKKQRIEHGLPKSKYYEACVVGKSTPGKLAIRQKYVQVWTAVGRGSRKMCNTDKYGFPVSHRARQKMRFGFMTGDLVVAEIPKGKYAGRWVGRVAVRSSGYFDVKDGAGRRVCQGVSHRHFRLLQRANGWQYEKEGVAG
ncbi:MAG: RNA-guided endonuclease IscB [Peptococcaceae bacterium MAG4]|nr:RNA-guided endonuclease IscB [Peptococcaceae bacterium MAG4]